MVYYPRTGYTRLVVRGLAEKFSADLEELTDRKKRIGPMAITVTGKNATAAKTTGLRVLMHDL